MKTRKRNDGVAVRHDAKSKDKWHIGCIVDSRVKQDGDVSLGDLSRFQPCRG